jgi:hypothetical protein
MVTWKGGYWVAVVLFLFSTVLVDSWIALKGEGWLSMPAFTIVLARRDWYCCYMVGIALLIHGALLLAWHSGLIISKSSRFYDSLVSLLGVPKRGALLPDISGWSTSLFRQLLCAVSMTIAAALLCSSADYLDYNYVGYLYPVEAFVLRHGGALVVGLLLCLHAIYRPQHYAHFNFWQYSTDVSTPRREGEGIEVGAVEIERKEGRRHRRFRECAGPAVLLLLTSLHLWTEASIRFGVWGISLGTITALGAHVAAVFIRLGGWVLLPFAWLRVQSSLGLCLSLVWFFYLVAFIFRMASLPADMTWENSRQKIFCTSFPGHACSKDRQYTVLWASLSQVAGVILLWIALRQGQDRHESAKNSHNHSNNHRLAPSSVAMLLTALWQFTIWQQASVSVVWYILTALAETAPLPSLLALVGWIALILALHQSPG